MDNAYVQMIIDERNKLKISSSELCEGICTAEQFYQVESGKRDISRVISERLLSRLGIDSGNYEHYLDYPDYDVWKRRMRIINCIEDNKLEEAEYLLDEYELNYTFKSNKSKDKLEKQFVLFMRLQILKHQGSANDIGGIQNKYEEVVKITVPNIDDKSINKLLLSPMEFVLALEYKQAKNFALPVEEKWSMYSEFLEYICTSPLGKVSIVKVYQKAFVCMYKDIAPIIDERYDEYSVELHEELLNYSEKAFGYIRQRKLMYYLTEILEIRLELLCWLKKNKKDVYNSNSYKEFMEQTKNHLEVLKGLYKEYNINCYMVDDCYLYRESGVYCINEVIKTRREMMGVTQEQLAGTDINASTVCRIEKRKQAVTHKIAKKLFDRLNLYPSCINMGIVTDKKDALQLYEELRYAVNSFKLEEVKVIIDKLKAILSKHRINEQILLCMESRNELWLGNIDKDEYTRRLLKALESTISLSAIQSGKKIFLTTEELTSLYLISEHYKCESENEKALMYIKELYEYCKEFENEEIIDGRIGIYEMIMAYVASLYGDIERYGESNAISENLIRMCLKFKRSNRVHSNMYDIAWNNDALKNSHYDYNAQLQRCISMSQLLGDANDERFYIENLKPTE